MTKYDIIFESLQEKVNSGELTVEDAEILNDVAYEKYGDDDTEYEEELISEATRLAKEIHKKQQETSDMYRTYVNAYKKYKEKAKKEKDPRTKETFEKLEKKYKKKADVADHNKEYYKHIDTIRTGELVGKLKRNEEEFADYKVAKKLAQRLQDKYVIKGKLGKTKQQLDYGTKPSKKSLENRPANRFV